MKIKKYVLALPVIAMLIVSSACGNSGVENTEVTQGSEIVQETESEFYIEIADAADILIKVWDTYAEEERFDSMGGHFTAGAMGVPAKYDLAQTTDLVEMYCVPETYLQIIDDAATIIDFYNAARFTAGVYHVIEQEAIPSLVAEMKAQVANNEWHGEVPEKMMVIKVDEQYVVAVYGREELVNQFKQKLESVYQTMIEVLVEEKLF